MSSQTIFNSGKLSGKREVGVAFMWTGTSTYLTNFKPIHETLCAFRIKAKLFNIWLVNIYAPTEEKGDEVKEQFYDRLERLYDSLPPNVIKILLRQKFGYKIDTLFTQAHSQVLNFKDPRNKN